MPAASAPVFNRLIRCLPRKEREKVLSGCESVELVFGDILYEQDEQIQHVYFPLESFISLVATAGNRTSLEMGLTGCEGMLGGTLVLGESTAALQAIVQGAGTALRMTSAQFMKASRDNPALLHVINRYLYVQINQLSQTGVCTHFHIIEERLARWLLMTHDRAHSDHFHLTHEFLAGMLGVRRSAVTIAAGALQKRNLIGYSRGEITVLDRPGLEAASCECYQKIQTTYTRVLSRIEHEMHASAKRPANRLIG